MISNTDLSFRYHDGPEFRFPAMSCAAKETQLILGKSGVGKTTLLHLLGGIINPEQGSVSIDGTELGEISRTKLDQFRGQNIGIIFQKPHFISSITILENLSLARKLAGHSSNRKSILEILEQLEISHRANAKPMLLSQGELQRASVARAVLNRPKVILADEPTSALDDDSCKNVLHLLKKSAAESNAALVIVTHDVRIKNEVDHQITLS